jgi:hypothetical protein
MIRLVQIAAALVVVWLLQPLTGKAFGGFAEVTSALATRSE